MSFLMNIMHSTSSFVPLKPPSLQLLPRNTFGFCSKTCLLTSHSIGFPLTSPNSSCKLRFSIGAATPKDKESGVLVGDFLEKDWSLLDTDDPSTDGGHMQKIDRIISAGKIEETSRILVSIGSEAFVDRVAFSSHSEQLVVVHDSIFILASIKEKYDEVKCWQGELINLPDKWTPFDVVFLYFLPALPYELDQILAALARHCLPGARVLISHLQGRQVVEEQRRQYPDVVVSNLPDKTTLQSAAADHSFEVVEFLDEPQFYLAVLRLNR